LLKAAYDQVLEWEKRYQKKRLVTASNVSQSHNRLRQLLVSGKENLQKQNFTEAESDFVEAIKLDHKNLEAYRGLGELYWQQEDLRQAKETYEFLSRLVPTEASVLERLAVLSQKIGDLAAAEAYYLKAIAGAKQNAALYFALAEIYQQVGENNLSFKTLLEAQRLEPNNAKIIDKLIEISIILKDSEAAKQFLAHLKNLNPENQKILEWEEQISQLKEA
jgi:Flp pilus assembly protein TadD